MTTGTNYKPKKMSTVSARLTNGITSSVWLIVIILHKYNWMPLHLDTSEDMHLYGHIGFCIATIFFTSFSFLILNDYSKRLCKVFSLLLGSLFHSITAAYFVTIFPPLDLMLLVCSGFALWFLLAALYIIKSEGLRYVSKY